MLHGNFITDEYTHTLRLESELSDLRVGYANPCDIRRCVRFLVRVTKKEKQPNPE